MKTSFEPQHSNFLDDSMSNATGDANSDAKKKLQSICGKKPLIGKKKKAAYQKCVDANAETGVDITSKVETGTDVTSTVIPTKDATTTTKTTETTTTITPPPTTTPDTTDSDDSSNGNILGMPPIVVYGLGALLIVGGFFAVKHFIKKGHASS